MKQTTTKTVTVTAMSFDRDMNAVPRRIEYEGSSIDLIRQELSVRIGNAMRVVTLSDGIRMFRLRSDTRGSAWELLGVE